MLLVCNDERRDGDCRRVKEKRWQVWKSSELLARWPILFEESTDDKLYQPQFQVEYHSGGGLLSYRVIVHSGIVHS